MITITMMMMMIMMTTTIIKRRVKKGASVRRNELRARVEGKFEIRDTSSFPYHVGDDRFRLSRTWAVFDENTKPSSVVVDVRNQVFFPDDQLTVNYRPAATAGG